MPEWSNRSVFASSMSLPTTSTSTDDPAAAPSGASRSNRGDGRSARTEETRNRRARREAERIESLISRVGPARGRSMLQTGLQETECVGDARQLLQGGHRRKSARTESRRGGTDLLQSSSRRRTTPAGPFRASRQFVP